MWSHPHDLPTNIHLSSTQHQLPGQAGRKEKVRHSLRPTQASGRSSSRRQGEESKFCKVKRMPWPRFETSWWVQSCRCQCWARYGIWQTRTRMEASTGKSFPQPTTLGSVGKAPRIADTSSQSQCTLCIGLSKETWSQTSFPPSWAKTRCWNSS